MELVNILCIAIEIILIVSFYFLGKGKSMPKGEPCNITVTSINTKCEYHAVRYRIRNNVMDIKIYNNFTGNYEWYSLFHFENPFLIVYTLTRDLDLAYKMSYGISPKNFTNSQK